MKQKYVKPADRQAKNDLSFIPPVTEQVQYIELADRFLAEDLRTQQLLPSDQAGFRGSHLRKRTKAHKAA